MITKNSKVIDHIIRVDIHIIDGRIDSTNVVNQDSLNRLGEEIAREYGIIVDVGKVVVKKITG